jgi:hypothetical protein
VPEAKVLYLINIDHTGIAPLALGTLGFKPSIPFSSGIPFKDKSIVEKNIIMIYFVLLVYW